MLTQLFNRRSEAQEEKVSSSSRNTTTKMALVQGYSSDEDDDFSHSSVPGPSTSRAGTSKSVQAAPEVSLEVLLSFKSSTH